MHGSGENPMSGGMDVRGGGAGDRDLTTAAAHGNCCASARILEIQRDLAMGLFSCASLDACLELLLEAALRLPGFDCGGAYVRCGGNGALRLVAHRDLSPQFVQLATYYPEESFQARLIAEGKLLYDMVADLPPEIARRIQAEGMRCLAVLPIQLDGQSVACLCVSSRTHHEVSQPLRLALEGFIALAGGALGLIESREQLEARVAARTAELEEANTVLREQAARLDLALSASGAGVSAWEPATGILEWDLRVRRLFGFSDEEPITMEKALSRVHPEDRARLLEDIGKIQDPQAGDVWSHEFRIQHPEDGERWIGRTGRIERDGAGHPIRTLGISMDITRRKADELALRASEEKYRLLHDSISDAFAGVNFEGRIIDSNPAFREMIGYSAEELENMTFKDITPERWHAFESEIANAAEFFERGYSEVYEKEYRRKDGSEFPVELRAFMIRDTFGQPKMIWAIIRDITARKLAEQTMLDWNQALERRVGERTALLHQSEIRFRQLAEAAFEGIGVTENGILLDCNEQLARLHGRRNEAMIGLHLIDLIAPEAREELRSRLFDDNSDYFETTCLRCDGTTYPAEIRLSARNWDGRQILVAAVRDVTEIKEAAARVQTLQTELQSAQRLGLVSEISAGIIHQIGQPLTSMGLNLSVAIDRLRAVDSRPGVVEVLEDVERDLRMVRKTITHLRSLANPGRPALSRFDVNGMVMDVLGLIAREASRRRVRIEADLRRNLPEVDGDPVQLSQVLLVLLHNAFDAVEPLLPERRIVRVVSESLSPFRIALRVIDCGEGISVEVQERLFSPFLTSKPDGLGIGLRLSQTIVQAHGGSIEGRNRTDGSGAEFEVLLPVAAAGE